MAKNRYKFKRQQNLKRKKIRKRFFQVTLIIMMLLGGDYLIFTQKLIEKSIDKSYNQFEAFFKKEGRLVFVGGNSNEIMKRIDIEVANNYYERASTGINVETFYV